MSLTLVIGGTRSGKSAHAEALARASGLPVRYVATADATDPAMAERISAHVARRPSDWATVNATTRLVDGVADARGMCVLLDGLGVWIAGAMHRVDVLAEVAAALEAIEHTALMIVVAEQAGEGLLPADQVSRAWLDLLGEATQRLAARAERVELVVAGRALSIASHPSLGVASPATDGRSYPVGLAYEEMAALRLHGDRAVRPGDADHAVNVLCGGPPEWLLTELRDALERDTGRYPDEGEANVALAALHGRDPREILTTNGAAEALWLLAPALRPTLAACVHPGFTEAEAALRTHGIPVVRVLRERERGFQLDPAAVPAAADLVVVGNPASPSGTLDPAAALLAMRRPGRVLVVDEAFMDLVPGEPATLVRERLDDVIVLRSLTKVLAIPGLRAGYALSSVSLASRLRDVRPPWSANTLALAALVAATSRPDALAALAERANAEREDLEGRLAGVVGVRTWPAAANFCLLEVADGPGVIAALREQRIAVRAAASFPGLGPGYLRVTARAPSENERFVKALAQALQETSENAPVRALGTR